MAASTGVTSDLPRRIWEHKTKHQEGFTNKYNLTNLVYYELHEDMQQAILREKQLKAGSRQTKLALIESTNPEWRDLYPELVP